jgi:prephenate dehydrogenase
LFREDAIVTDAGSTKEQIAGAARTHVTRALFIGGHPMAGKERSGVQEAEAGLFEGRKYILTPLTKEQSRPHNSGLSLSGLRGLVRTQ